MTSCTILALRDADLAHPGDHTIADSSSDPDAVRAMTFELATRWRALHALLGNHAGDHVLAFLVDGGKHFPALDDGSRSSGRFFSSETVVAILAAVEQVVDEQLVSTGPARRIPEAERAAALDDLTRLRQFLAQAAAAERGIVVHVFQAAR